MNFEGQYLTYTEYQELGGNLPQTPFNLLEYELRKRLDLYTKRRLVDETDIPNEVKMCMFKMMTDVEKYATDSNINLNYSQETIDGYSITYGGAQSIQQLISAKQFELNETMMSYLYGVIINNEHLIYQGQL